MQNLNIELSSRHPQIHHYQPQEDEEPDQPAPEQPQNPQNSSLEDKVKACIQKIFTMDLEKAIRMTFKLILFLLFIDLGPVFIFTYYLGHAKLETAVIQSSIARPLEFMSANLKADPIMDLQIIDKKSACPLGFEPLKLDTWSGTVAGCLCDNGDLLDSSCEIIERPGKCEKEIPSIPPVEIYEVDESIWCAKRAVLGTDYLKKAECPAGYKECYPGGCFIKGECPITQVEMTSKRVLVLTRKQGELPLIDIHISPHDVPCFNQDLYEKSPHNPSYKLSAIKENGCGKYGLGSQFSAILASSFILDSYTQNSFRYSVMNLPHFKDYAKNTMSVLSSKVRMKTVKHDDCLDIDEKSIQNYLKAFQNSFPSFPMTICPLIGHLIFFVMIFIQRITRTKEEFFENLAKDILGLCRFILVWYLPLICRLFLCLDDYQQFITMKKYFEGFDLMECFGESQGSVVIRDYLESMWMGEVSYWLYFGLVASDSLVILACVWLHIVKKFSLPI